jgi:hypothetical protein
MKLTLNGPNGKKFKLTDHIRTSSKRNSCNRENILLTVGSKTISFFAELNYFPTAQKNGEVTYDFIKCRLDPFLYSHTVK